MRLALKAQNQARATLQTLGELKAPKQVAFVQGATSAIRCAKSTARPRNLRRTRKTKKRQTNYWRCSMANGWTPERRPAGSAAIRQWQPWKSSTGPVSVGGKAKASRNADKARNENGSCVS